MARPKNSSRQSFLVPGVTRYSRSKMQTRSGAWASKNKKQVKAPAKTIAKKKPAAKPARFYPAEDVHRPMPSRRATQKPTRLRASITPGTILILLAGRYKGARVVFLKQLPSGLLLVTGPYKVNGVPLRRVNQAYVVATSTKIDISGMQVPDTVNDAFFTRPKKAATKKSEGQFFEEEQSQTKVVDEAHKTAQKTVDAALLPLIAKVPQLKAYLASKFTLSGGQFPHELKF